MQDAKKKFKKKYEFFPSSEVKMKKNNNHNKLLNKPNWIKYLFIARDENRNSIDLWGHENYKKISEQNSSIDLSFSTNLN